MVNSVVYSVAAVRPESVREELQRVWRANLPLKTSSEAKFEHLYGQTLEPPTDVLVLRAKDGEAAEEIVGTIGMCVRRYRMGEGEVRAAVCADFAVDVAHRLLLPALRLARMARDHVREHFQLGYGYPNKNASGVMLRAGFSELGQTSRHVYVLRPAAYLARIGDLPLPMKRAVAGLLARSLISRTVGPIANASRMALDVVRAAPAAYGYRLKWSDSPDARVDALWEAARHEYQIVGSRTSSFLSSRYPDARFASLFRRRGDLRAYAISETDPATGAAHIRDLFGYHDAFGPLLDLLLPSLWRRGATSVSVRLLGAPRVRHVLGRRGFTPRSEHRVVVVQVGDRAPKGVDPTHPDSWHLFDADEDV